VTVDRLEQAPVTRSARTRLLGAVLVTAVLVAAGADQVARDREQQALGRCVRAAGVQLSHATEYVRGVAQYASPSLSSPLVTLSVRRSLRAIVQDAAAQGVAPIAEQRVACAQVHVLAWHRSQRHARAAYLAYLDAEAAGLSAIAADFGNYGVADATATALRTRAQRALDRAGVSP
jgi:hypothetical protein